MRCSLVLVATCGALVAPLAAQQSGWRLIETQDELAGGPPKDQRLILRAEGWTPGGPTLIVACGDRLPASERRTLLFNGGQPLQPFGADPLAYAEVRFDAQPATLAYWAQYGSAGLAFIGSTQDSHLDAGFFATLLGADTLRIRYRVLNGERTARFAIGD